MAPHPVRRVGRVVAATGVPVIPLTVVTATIPERADMLHELGQCIARQTVRPYEWIVATDWDREGPAAVLKRLVADVDTEWVFRCDDDDLYDPNHFEVIGANLTDRADIVYTWPRIDPLGHFDDPTRGTPCRTPQISVRSRRREAELCRDNATTSTTPRRAKRAHSPNKSSRPDGKR